MKKQEIVNSISRTFYKAKFSLIKHSPEILVVTGVVGMVTGTVLACKATRKVNDILEDAKADIDKIHSEENDDKKKDLTIAYAKAGANLVRLYAPAVTVSVASITAIFAANDILKKRNVAIAAAYTTVDTAFKEYRSRVVDKFGEEVDHDLKYGIERIKVETEEEDEETGKKKKVKTEVEVADDNLSGYARYFDKSSDCYDKAPGYNLSFLRAQENFANDLLRSRGYMFLNDVYDALGIPRTKVGQVVGWLYKPDDPNFQSFIDFGIRKINRKTLKDFDDGLEDAILLDFNVDGNIINSFCK